MESSPEQRLRVVEEKVEWLQRRLQWAEARIAAAPGGQAAPAQAEGVSAPSDRVAPGPIPVAPPAAGTPSTPTPAVPPVSGVAEGPQAAASMPPPLPMRSPSVVGGKQPATGHQGRPSADRSARPGAPTFEDLFGGRVLAVAGGVAIVLGVVFFLVMAVSRGWIDEPTRVLLAFLGSTGLLATGLWLHERHGQTEAAQAAVAAAIAALYLTLIAATELYGLVSPELGLAMAALVGASAAAIAVRWGSPFVGGLGVIGALLAPALVGAGSSGAALTYMGIALAAAVGVLLWRRWDWLAAAAFAVSAPQLLVWVVDGYDTRLALTLSVLLAFWLLNLFAAIGYELRVPAQDLRASSAMLLFANVLLIAGTGYAVLHDVGHPTGATAWVLLIAVAHVALGLTALAQARISREVGALLVALGVALSGIGLALALSGPALVVGWAVHATVLAWLAARSNDQRAGFGSLAFFGLVVGHVLLFEAPLSALTDGVDDLASAVIALAVAGAAALACADLLPPAPDRRKDLLQALGATALVYLCSVVIIESWGATNELGARQEGQVMLSAFWGVTGVGALVYGLVRDDRRLRIGGLGLLSVAIMKVFLYDLAALDSIYRVASFIAVGLLLLVGAFAYQRVRLGVAPKSGEGAG